MVCRLICPIKILKRFNAKSIQRKGHTPINKSFASEFSNLSENSNKPLLCSEF